MNDLARLYYAGVEAAEDILRGVFRVDIAKALDPTNPRDFLVVSQRLGNALHGIAGDAEAVALKHALDTLDVDWKKLDDAGKDAVIAAAKKHIGQAAKNVIPKAVQVYEASAQKVVNGTKENVNAKYGIGLAASFTKTDERIMHHAASSQALYIRNEYGTREERFSKLARQIVKDGIADGLDRYDIGARLKAGIGDVVKRSDAYWQMAAGVFVNRARTYASLSSFTAGGFQRFVFQAVLDEVTTLQCRMMHGRSFSVSVAMQKYEETANLADPEDVRFTMPWLQAGKAADGTEHVYYKEKDGSKTSVASVVTNTLGVKDNPGKFSPKLSDAELQARGVTVPPLHANCRSMIEPDFDAISDEVPGYDKGPPQYSQGNVMMTPRPAPQFELPMRQTGPGIGLEQPNVMMTPRPGGLSPFLQDELLAAGEQVSAAQAARAAALAAQDAAALAAAEAAAAEAALKLAAAKVAAEAAALQAAEEAAKLAAEQAKQAALLGDLKAKAAAAEKMVDAMPTFGGKKAWKKTDLPLPPPHPNAPGGGHFVPYNDPPPMSLKYAKIKNTTATVPVGDLIDTSTSVSAQKIKSALKVLDDGTLAYQSDLPTFIKYQGKYYVHEGTNAGVHAAKLMGDGQVKGYVVDYDAKVPQGLKGIGAHKAPPAAPHVTPTPASVIAPPAPPVAPAVPPKPAFVPGASSPNAGALGDASNIMHTKTGAAKGSNSGGFYTGADGVKRYVKEYTDTAQASGEHAANQIYQQLGLGAPKSTIFAKDGKYFYASDIIDDTVTLGAKGITKQLADNVLDGFVADVLTANWDAVGMSMDNVMVHANGAIFRIDNGGTFLMRAQAGRKPGSVLNDISEWDVFFSPKNPSYQKVLSTAGITEHDEMKDRIVQQIDKVLALRDHHGGWAKWFDKHVPHVASETDRKAMVDMLEARSKLLEKKRAELLKPKPAPAPPKVWAPGEKKHVSLFHEDAAMKQHFPTKDPVGKHAVRGDSPIGEKTPFGKMHFGVKETDSYWWTEQQAKTGMNATHRGKLHSSIEEWTGGYKDSTMQNRYYKAAEKIMHGKGDGGNMHETLVAGQQGRGKRIAAFLKKVGVDTPDEVTHVDVMRGCDGDIFIKDVAMAWADDKATHANFRCYEVASWGRSYDNSKGFAKGHGVVARWRECPLDNVLADQLADDSSFKTSFLGEKEVIAGLGHRKGVPLPVQDFEVHYKGRVYTYDMRKELLDQLKKDGML